MSIAINLVDVASLLDEIQIFLGEKFSEEYKNSVQEIVLALLNAGLVNSNSHYGSLVSDKVQEVNQWLRERGSSLYLEDTGPGGVYAASISKLLLQWLEKADQCLFRMDQVDYPGISIDRDDIFGWKGPDGQVRLVEIPTKDASVFVRMATVVQPPENMVELVDSISYLLYPGDQEEVCTPKVIVPKINLELQAKLTDLLGMKIGCREVTQVAQKINLGMSEAGVKVRTETVAGLTLGGSFKPAFYPTKPFLFSIFRGNVPLFVAYLTPECYADPDR